MPFKNKFEFLILEDFLKRSGRFFFSDEMKVFFENLRISSENRMQIVKKSEIFWRAQIGSTRYSVRQLKRLRSPTKLMDAFNPLPLPAKRMSGPPIALATSGRANSRGMPFLYLSREFDTAIAETRPWVGAHVTVVNFKICRDLTVLNLTARRQWTISAGMPEFQVPAEQTENSIWSDINDAFSFPCSPYERDDGYLATQCIAELFKNEGFDGIRYKSALCPEGRDNLVLFNPSDGKQMKPRRLYRVSSVICRSEAIG